MACVTTAGYGVHQPGVQLRSQAAAPVRDPFGWREALSPECSSGVSPASTARSSRTGSLPTSEAGTPRNATPPKFQGHTSPVSPAECSHPSTPSSTAPPVSSRSARSDRSTRSTCSQATSSSSCGSSRYSTRSDCSARSGSRHDGQYATPQASARSDFLSVYDQASARSISFGAVYEDEMSAEDACGAVGVGGHATPLEVGGGGSRPSTGGSGNRSRHRAISAALDNLAAAGLPEHEADGRSVYCEEAPEPSLDPRQVVSAARHGRYRDVEASLVAGFDPSYEADAFGNTLFHVACQNGNKRIAKMAIKYGGDMDAPNAKGNTGLHFLFAYGYGEDIGEYFIEKGASVDLLNDLGKTAREGIR